MSRNEYITTLEKQLRVLNNKIDAKIVSGQKYVDEARAHRLILRKIRTQQKGFLGRVLPLFA